MAGHCIIHGRLLIDPYEPPPLGWLAIEEGVIAEVGLGEPPEPPHFRGHEREAVICPGFIDAHIHVPQIDAVGRGGFPLLTWLEEVIFPAEARWSSPQWAAQQVDSFHRRLLHEGTLGYAGYLTSHQHGLGILTENLRRWPLRSIAGQVLMDRAAPPSLLDQPIGPMRQSADVRFTPSANPRFAVSCSNRCLALASELAHGQWPIQTHLAESSEECSVVGEQFPSDSHYTAVYDRHGLLTPCTLLAHCIHLSDEEWQLIADRHSVVVHCPAANTFLESGVFDIGAAQRHGVRIALGSDVAAGPDVAMPRVARSMIETAKFRRMTLDRTAPIPTPADAWWQITTGNAEALGWGDAGRLSIGAAADVLLLELPFDIDEHLVSRLIYTWDPEWITGRFVGGHPISPEDLRKPGYTT